MPLATGPIFQLAWVVDDIEAAEVRLGDTLGVARWTRIPDVPFGPDTTTFRGSPADFSAHISLAYAGDQQLELIEPTRGTSLYTEHLETHGPGLHHVAHLVDDLDTALAEARARGLEVAQQGAFPGDSLRFAYLDGGALGASHLELLQLSPDMVRFFDSLKEGGA